MSSQYIKEHFAWTPRSLAAAVPSESLITVEFLSKPVLIHNLLQHPNSLKNYSGIKIFDGQCNERYISSKNVSFTLGWTPLL